MLISQLSVPLILYAVPFFCWHGGAKLWVLLTAPDRRRTILVGKWLLCTLVCSAIGIVLSLVAGLVYRAGVLTIALQMTVMMIAAGALCALGIGISAVFPRFQHDNPAVRVSPWALIIGFVTASGYVVVSCLIFVVGAYLISLNGAKASIFAFCTALFALLTFAVTTIPLAIGARCIERYEWQH